MARAPWEITREMFLSVAETEALLSHVRGKAQEGRLAEFLDRLIIEVMLFSGLRNSEFCRLRVADTRLGTGQSAFVIPGREDQGRVVQVPDEVSRLVERYAAEFRSRLLPSGVQPDDPDQPLIFHERRRPYERTGLYRRVVRILTTAGLGNRASVQLLRHTYGYLAYLRTGGNLLFVQRQLGHAHPMITSIYAQFVDESYADLAEQVFAFPAGREVEHTVERVPEWTSAVEEFRSEYD